MTKVTTHQAKSQLSKLLKLVEQGKRVRIYRGKVPIADLRPIKQRKRNPLEVHPELSKVIIRTDLVAPLTEDEWPESAR